jgi:hypothetical protein
MKSQTERATEEQPWVKVKLTNVSSFHNLEADEVKHSGDVIEVEERRAVALIQQGLAQEVKSKSKKK